MHNKNVLLIYPPARLNKKALFGLPPLGILYIASYLNNHSIKTYILDMEIESISYKNLLNIIVDHNIGLLGFSVITVFLNSVLELSEKLKTDLDNLCIVLGGPHISGTLIETLEYDLNIDYLIYGEGEKAMLGLIQALDENKPLQNIPNLIYRSERDIIINKPQQFISDLDDLPFPELDNIIKYRSDLYKVPYSLNRTSSIITSRGCPYSCNFCSAYITHGHKWRNRSIENIIDELKYNNDKYKIQYFVIKDSLFTKDMDWTHEFCERVLESGLKLNFRCNTRVDCVNESLLKHMKKCGFDMINFGVESGDEQMLNTINKQLDKSLAIETFKTANKLKIKTHATFMVGNINETLKSIENTINFAKELDPFFTRFFPAIAYPGTELYNYAISNELVEKQWYRSDLFKEISTERYLFPEFKKGPLLFNDFDPNKIARKIFWKFYLRPKVIFRFLKMMFVNKNYFLNLLRAGRSLIKYYLFK